MVSNFYPSNLLSCMLWSVFGYSTALKVFAALQIFTEPLLCTQEVILFEKLVLGFKKELGGRGGRGQTLVKRERQSSVTKNL